MNGIRSEARGCVFRRHVHSDERHVLVERDGVQWFDLTAFADLLGQPYVADANPASELRGDPGQARAHSAECDGAGFRVKDRQGKVIRLADFKGKKALIVTWSSW